MSKPARVNPVRRTQPRAPPRRKQARACGYLADLESADPGSVRHDREFLYARKQDWEAAPIDPRLNAEIRVPQVRLVDQDGAQVGIVSLADALTMARDAALDLVEVAPNADPPVCRIMDYGRFKYQEAQKQKEARKKQSQIVIKEIKMRPKISNNDYDTKSGHVRRFLEDGAKVKATIMFRGREMSHTELGQRLLDRLAGDMAEISNIEAYPKVDGRNMVMVLSPTKSPKPRGPRAAAADGNGEVTPDVVMDADDGTVLVAEASTEDGEATAAAPDLAPDSTPDQSDGDSESPPLDDSGDASVEQRAAPTAAPTAANEATDETEDA